ncbi:ATP-dependent acyl-CoA ligase [Jiella mangrovi]|uniref:AMP-binding protein n=1 Tax=Jiella mangrovi TaxID=2821407 RepID=A0ABS4BF05_9HYPH|nr:ATP-dependent acyl-CoA ligase [Jiella mangrovi]MBP0614540.1 AMP-binding protein [Jiella mangrovi]
MDKRVLSDLMTEQANRFGEREFVVIGETRLSFAGAVEAASRRASALAGIGIGRGDRVALMVSNRVEFLEVFFACAWLGAIAVPINGASRGLQLQHILGNCGAKLLVIEDSLADCLGTIDLQASALAKIWVVGDVAAVPHGGAIAMPEAGGLREAAASTAGDLAAIIYTSGTTGPSKGVCCPHGQLYWWGANTADILGVTQSDRLYTSLPLFHVNALNTVYQALITGATVIVGQRFSASGFLPAMIEHRATVTYLLGAMVPILLSRPASDLDRAHFLRIALGPGAPARFHGPFHERFGFRLVEGYGSTETNFVIAGQPGEGVTGAMGTLRPGFEAKVVDENDEALPAGEAGELILRADEPFAFSSGYFGMPDKTVEAWRNFWFHTGDRVVRNADGSFRFIDRMKDAIRRRGENISSFEVEQALLAHPAIATVAVFAVRAEMAEDEVMAAIVPATGSVIDPAELIAFCRSRLSYFAIPRFIDIVDSLPVTENGKVRKHALSERGVSAATFDREAHGIAVR